MASSRARTIAGITAIIISIFLLYILSGLPLKGSPETPSHLNFVSSIILSFNVAILLAWLAFGIFPGTIFSLFLFLSVFILDVRIGSYGYSVFTLSFFITAFIGYALCKIKSNQDRSFLIKLEKLEERINLLNNSVSEKEVNISSVEEKLKRYSVLKEVVESLSAVLMLEDINRLIIDKALKIIGKGDRGLLFLVDTEKQDLMLASSLGAEKVKTKKGDVFDHWVLRHRKSLMVEDTTRDFRFSAEEASRENGLFRSLIATPLVSENKVIGALRLDSPREFTYSQDDLRLLDIISDFAAVAIQNGLLYSKTQELAIRDGLTGLFVRRYFTERFKEEIKRIAGKKKSLSVILLDIDHFKKYNDEYGHTSGDLVLKHLASAVNSMTKEGDIAARYGGEEIIIMLLGMDRPQAAAKAEALRKVIKDKPLMLRRNKADITVSIGVSSYPDDAILEEELIRIADQRLYKAKARGRDRVCSA